jgi:hypothetical protein
LSGDEKGKISSEIADLINLSVSELKDRWRSVYGADPPPRSSRKLLVSAIAYRMRSGRSVGSLRLCAACSSAFSDDAGARRLSRIRPVTRATAGTVLIRDWQGKSRHVTVLDRGVLCRKKNYRSLSQVARVITGCRWSGPLFFGLKGRARRGLVERDKSPVQRYAVYTRKSSEEGLDQDFNSLHAQREACESFIKSQAGRVDVWSRPLTMTVAYRAARWSAGNCGAYCLISTTAGST